jgi:hypothetical protein
MNPTKKLLTVLLISLALCGVQAVQASPLHDHVNHVSSCSLCHFDGAQALQAEGTGHGWITTSSIIITRATVQAPLTTPYPAFHGRAPPSYSL